MALLQDSRRSSHEDIFYDPPDDPSLDADLWRLATRLWTGRWLIVAGTSVSALVAFVVSSYMPKSYEAVATVFITPPTFSTELKPAPLSVEAYARLAESDFVRARVEQKLREERVLGPEDSVGRLRTSLYSSREPQKPYLPLIGLSATAGDPGLTQRVANTWASVFVEEQTKLALLGKSGSVEFILSEHPKASDRLLTAERRLSELQSAHSRALAEAETRASIELKEARLKAREASLVELESGLSRARIDLREAQQRLRQAEEELRKTPAFITVTKAVTDDALWQSLASGTAGQSASVPAALASTRLQSQEVNPVHTSLSQTVADERVAASALGAREETFTRELAAVRTESAALRADLVASRMDMDNLRRTLATDIAPMTRAVEESKSMFSQLDQKVGQAIIAKSERDADVKVGALAELPRGPVGPSPMRSAAIAGLIGFAASLLAVWILGHLRRNAPAPTVTAPLTM